MSVIVWRASGICRHQYSEGLLLTTSATATTTATDDNNQFNSRRNINRPNI
jgi:hypothetical protein